VYKINQQLKSKAYFEIDINKHTEGLFMLLTVYVDFRGDFYGTKI